MCSVKSGVVRPQVRVNRGFALKKKFRYFWFGLFRLRFAIVNHPPVVLLLPQVVQFMSNRRISAVSINPVKSRWSINSARSNWVIPSLLRSSLKRRRPATSCTRMHIILAYFVSKIHSKFVTMIYKINGEKLLVWACFTAPEKLELDWLRPTLQLHLEKTCTWTDNVVTCRILYETLLCNDSIRRYPYYPESGLWLAHAPATYTRPRRMIGLLVSRLGFP